MQNSEKYSCILIQLKTLKDEAKSLKSSLESEN